MSIERINAEIMEYMVWVIELTAKELFGNDKSLAYSALKEHGLWDAYVQSFDVTHTLGANHIVLEVRDALTAKGVI